MKRIISSWGTRMTSEDLAFIDFYLDEPGKFLFWQMSKIDRQHALTVAQSALTKSTLTNEKIDLNKLVTAALLHDIGKVEGDFSFLSRIIVGFIRRVKPTLRNKLAMRYPASFWEKVRYGFYVDLVHPARGAHMAKLFGVENDITEIIRHHHDPPCLGQSIELTWLQLIDSKN
jgi:putative nucleotidyltransferase with HDIG domain